MVNYNYNLRNIFRKLNAGVKNTLAAFLLICLQANAQIDSIPICTSVWIYNGGTGVVPDSNYLGLTMNFPIADVSGTNLGTNVNLVGVSLHIQHYRVGDLKIELISPAGTSVTLVDRMGYPATLPYGCVGDNIDATFLRGTGVEAENVCGLIPPTLSGSYSAAAGYNLNDINVAGGSPNGVWHLRVTDLASGEQGFVLGWKMYFDQQPPHAAYNLIGNGLFMDLTGQPTLQGGATYIWSFGDGDSATGQHVTHQYPFRGTFVLTLVVIDSCGSDTISQSYGLEAPPCYIEFPSTQTPTPITDNHPAGDTLIINTNTVIGYTLGKDVFLQKVCIQGTHTRVGDLKMKLISPGGVEVILMDQPFYPYLPFGCTYPNFNFCIIHGTSADNDYACDSTGAAVKGEFTAIMPQDLREVNDNVTNPNGTWKLIVYDLVSGHTGTVNNWSLIFANQDPLPNYTYTLSGLTVNITSLNLPINYHWDFGDGTPFDTTQSPSHNYATPGTKTITVYTDNGCGADTLVRTITLYACEQEFICPNVPVAVPDNDSTGVEIPFTISGVDGTTLGVDAFLTRVCIMSDHPFPGHLRVRLKAPNGVFVPLINRAFSTITYDGCGIPGVDICIVQGTGNDTRFVCDWNNGPPGIHGFFTALKGFPLENVNYAGGSPDGLWRLQAWDYLEYFIGNITGFKLYFGKLLPKAGFTYTVNVNGNAAFTSANVNTVSYLWSFGDGNTSTLANPVHNYNANGAYTVTLVANDSCVSDSSVQTVYVTTYNNGCIYPFNYTGGNVAVADADSVNGTTVNFNLNGVAGTSLGNDVNLVKIHITGKHTRVGDLKMKLIAPNGSSVILMDRPGYPATSTGCNGNDFDFFIANGLGATLENVCNVVPPALSGTYTAPAGNDLGALNFGGGSPNGNWQLVVYDYATGEVGEIEGISLFFDAQKPNANFTVTVNSDTASFHSEPDPIGTYYWTFGDGNFSTLANPVHVYADTGNYVVTLVVTDTCGTDSSSGIISIIGILESCVQGFSYDTITPIPDNDNAGVTISLNLNVAGNNLGTDVSLVKVCLSGTHTNVGDIAAKLIAPNGVIVQLIDRPGYPASSTGCTGDDFNVCFTGGTGNEIENVCLAGTPALSGLYSAANGENLTAINIAGGSPSGLWQIVISDLAAGETGSLNSVELFFNNQPHTNASFTDSVSLSNIYFTSVNQPGASYTWSFGDGDSAFFANPSHSYASSGTYTVTLSVADSCGTNTTSQNITVTIYPEPSCVKEFSFLNVPLHIPNNDSLGVNANLVLSNVSGTNLGADVNLVKVHIKGTHGRVGDLIAKLTAPNGQVITLMDRPGYPATSTGCNGDDFDFNVIRGINADVENVCAATVPTIQGTYSADNGQDLNAINIAGGSPNGTWTLNVSDNAQLSFGGDITGFDLFFDNQVTVDAAFTDSIIGNSVQFNSQNVPGTTYFWTFGNGGTSTDASPLYSYGLTGTYTVTLAATDSCGTDSTSQTINVTAYSEPSCTSTFDFPGVPMPIPDNDSIGVTAVINLTGVTGNNLGVDVSLVSVCITGEHTRVGDIKATLIAPNGVMIDLMDRPGYPSSPNGCPNNDFDFCVGRGIGNTVENICSSIPPAISGNFTAATGFNLDSINIAGGSPNGLWQLMIADLAQGDTGELMNVQLVFDQQPDADANFTLSATGGFDVMFTSANQPGINYSWNFGDNTTSTDANPAHTYLSNGAYTVTLTAGDSCGPVTTSQLLNVAVPFECTRDYAYPSVPVSIPDNDSSGITSVYTLNGVAGNVLGTDVRLTNVCVGGTHTNTGDLIIKLLAPNGKQVTLMDRPGYPATATGCTGDDFNFCVIGGVDFDNELACNAIAPAVSGTFSALNDNLDSINYYGGNPNGDWSLFISDNNATETGSLTGWSLQFDGQPPVADFTYTVTGGTVNFSGPTIPGAQYSWNFGDSIFDFTQNPSHTYTQNGSYLVVLTVTDSCGITNSSQVILITVGIEEIAVDFSFQVIPNPANNFVEIKVSNTKGEKLELSVLDNIGKNIFSVSIPRNSKIYNKRLDCSKWSRGIYLVKIQSSDGVHQRKLIIE